MSAALKREFPPTPDLVRELRPIRALADRERLQATPQEWTTLRKLRDAVRRDRAELTEFTVWLKENFNQPAPDDIEPSWFVQAVDEVSAKEQEAETLFRPLIAGFKDLLGPSTNKFETGVQQLLRDSIDFLEGWLAHYRSLHEMLLRHLAERQAAAKQVLRARPVAGEIDYAELSREHIARYRKIRAALAK